jgi:hypothetical protein
MRKVPASTRMHGLTIMTLIALSAAIFSGPVYAAAVDCATYKPLAPVKTNALQLTPIAEEMAAPNAQLGTGVGFAQLFSEGASVEVVLSRVQHQECRATAAARQPLPATASAGAYQPKPGESSTAWRFDMTQNGKRMTADEFDAWMKARGVRVVQGPAKPATAPAAPPAPPAAPAKKKKR